MALLGGVNEVNGFRGWRDCSEGMVLGTQAWQPSACSLTPSEPLRGDGGGVGRAEAHGTASLARKAVGSNKTGF